MVGRGVDDRPRSRHDGDLAALQQRLEALGQPVHDLLLAGLAGREVQGGLAGVDPELLRGRGRSGAPRRSGAAPWRVYSPDADRCRRLVSPRPWRSEARLRPRTGRPRSHRDRRPGRRRRTSQPPCSPPSGRSSASVIVRTRQGAPATIIDALRLAREENDHLDRERRQDDDPVTSASNISVRVFMPPSSPQPGVVGRLAADRGLASNSVQSAAMLMRRPAVGRDRGAGGHRWADIDSRIEGDGARP